MLLELRIIEILRHMHVLYNHDLHAPLTGALSPRQPALLPSPLLLRLRQLPALTHADSSGAAFATPSASGPTDTTLPVVNFLLQRHYILALRCGCSTCVPPAPIEGLHLPHSCIDPRTSREHHAVAAPETMSAFASRIVSTPVPWNRSSNGESHRSPFKH